MNEYVSVLNLSIKPVLAAQVCCKYWTWRMNSNLFEASFKIGAPTEGLIQCQDDLYHHLSEPAILRGQLVKRYQKIDTTSESPTWRVTCKCVFEACLYTDVMFTTQLKIETNTNKTPDTVVFSYV